MADLVAGDCSSLLLLADGRFPSGGHAHSAGLEAAVELEGIDGVAALEQFLIGRLTTGGAVAAAFAAAACSAYARGGTAVVGRMAELDSEMTARLPSPALRIASSRLGRQVLRAGRAIWPDPGLEDLAAAHGRGINHAVAFGAVGGAAGLAPEASALAAAHDSALSPATAAVRLLGLDPFAVHAALARLGPRIAAVATRAARYADVPPADLPSWASPLQDIAVEAHATWEVRLFAS